MHTRHMGALATIRSAAVGGRITSPHHCRRRRYWSPLRMKKSMTSRGCEKMTSRTCATLPPPCGFTIKSGRVVNMAGRSEAFNGERKSSSRKTGYEDGSFQLVSPCSGSGCVLLALPFTRDDAAVAVAQAGHGRRAHP
mmetsp:Transcript_24136/g.43046  ORF Transcript_24136/g.43046 Transcript_24136/m.43046 type:complete len:138 (-) Transcript_24136:202-615(-)